MAMDPDYIEKETKVLDVDVEALVKGLKEIGADLVYEDERLITYLDTEDRRLKSLQQTLKITDEGSIKVSLSTPIDTDEKENIKFKASRRKEALDLFGRLGYKPYAEVRQKRFSFELKGIDIDIDIFPEIPPFVEVDMGDNPLSLEQFLQDLGLGAKERVNMNTPEVFNRYKKNFFELFKV